ncbi:MAG: hypothetical protein CMM25_00535 [Rhodospirillaceae bacterium]|nr:hypothetical protein [Rhodospirillaceae bacterium]
MGYYVSESCRHKTPAKQKTFTVLAGSPQYSAGIGGLLFITIKTNHMKKIIVTQQEIQEAMKKRIYRNKKKYYRKAKHKNKTE